MTQIDDLEQPRTLPPRDEPAAGEAPSRRRPGLRLAILAGFLLWLACPPVTLWPLAWVALAPLIVSVTEARNARQAAWRGYLFGWAYLGPVWYWVGLTIVGWTESAIGWAAWFGLTLVLAGFYAAWGGAAWWLARRTSGGWRLVALAAAWVVMEWARTLGALTMPWAQLSYTQYRFLPLIQFADITGAYGISFLLMLVNGAVAHCWQHRKQPDRARWIWASLTLAVFCSLYGIARLREPEGGVPLKVAAMQGAFPMGRHLTEAELRRQNLQDLQTIADLTRRAYAATDPPPALTVWSESSAPGDAVYDPDLREVLEMLARTYQAPVLVGSRSLDPQTETESAVSVLFPADGSPPISYQKQQLVPFGEFIPFRNVMPPSLANSFQFFQHDVVPGSGPTVLSFRDPHAGEVVLGPFICYESMYPHYPRAMTQAGANLLVTQSNDAWFHSLAAMEQHTAAVVFRAIENRRDVVRSTTTGITCMLDSRGRIVARAPLYTSTFLTWTMRLLEGRTFYTRLGDWFVALCGLLVAAAGLRIGQNGRGGRRRVVPPGRQENTGEA